MRPLHVAAVFGVALAAVAGILWIWWPAGVVVGIVFSTVATVLIGRRLQDSHEQVPVDEDLLDLLQVGPPSSGGRVTRTVLAGGGRKGASIR